MPRNTDKKSNRKRNERSESKSVTSKSEVLPAKGCRREWVEKKEALVCRKVEVAHTEKRCRTVVKYRPVTKTIKITIQEVAIRDEKRVKCVDDAYCTRVCRWVDFCKNGNNKEDCTSKGCCGEWVPFKREKICHDKKVSCPEKIEYIEQIPYITERHEIVEVTVEEAYFEQEEYFVEITECDSVCEWQEQVFPEPPQGCPGKCGPRQE